MILFLILIIFSVGFIVGYKVGQWYSNGLNASLRTQVNLLTVHNKHWASEAGIKYNLAEQVSTQKNRDVAATMQTVVYMLQTMQQEQAHTIGTQDHERVAQLIAQARAIASP
jgi:hypothetical protein